MAGGTNMHEGEMQIFEGDGLLTTPEITAHKQGTAIISVKNGCAKYRLSKTHLHWPLAAPVILRTDRCCQRSGIRHASAQPVLGSEGRYVSGCAFHIRKVCSAVHKAAMRKADITESLCKPKALRHAFAVETGQKGIPLNIVQRWLGHARIETTAIYASAISDEERNLARRAWGSLELAIPERANAPS
jgi:integrase